MGFFNEVRLPYAVVLIHHITCVVAARSHMVFVGLLVVTRCIVLSHIQLQKNFIGHCKGQYSVGHWLKNITVMTKVIKGCLVDAIEIQVGVTPLVLSSLDHECLY